MATAHPQQYPWLWKAANAPEWKRTFPLKTSHLYRCSSFMSLWCTVTESATIVSPTREFVTLPWLSFNFTARPYPKPCWSLLKPSTTPSFPWMALRKENTVAAEGWGGWVLQSLEQSQCSNKAISWDPPVNLNTKFLIQFIRMQMQCEQLHQGKDRISLIRHAAAYVSFNMQCKIDTEWQTDDF